VYIVSDSTSGYSNLTWAIDSAGSLPCKTIPLALLVFQHSAFSSNTNEECLGNATISNSTTVGSLYIVPDSTTYASAGFVQSNSTTNVTGAVTSGFALFGGQVVFIDDSVYEAQFWAQTTDTDGVWSLKWNSDGSSQTDSTPVVIKTKAPITSS
jgi:hypothetical protein